MAESALFQGSAHELQEASSDLTVRHRYVQTCRSSESCEGRYHKEPERRFLEVLADYDEEVTVLELFFVHFFEGLRRFYVCDGVVD